jgi:hypothetical protein
MQWTENLIKGILVAEGLPVFVEGKFSRELNDHDLARLASKLSSKDLFVSPEDLSLLTDQKKYIEWAGRYPLPKSSGNYELLGHGTRERQLNWNCGRNSTIISIALLG